MGGSGGAGGGAGRRRDIKYRPLPSQQRFHESAARFKGFSGPIGSGKSQALCQEAIKLSYLNPGRTGLIGAPTYPMLRDATAASLLEVLDRNKIGHELNRAENFVLIRETRSKILFRAVEEFERLRGSNLAWFGLDELTYTSEQAWLRLEGRLRDPRASRLGGFAVWTPRGYDWVYERFVARKIEGYETILAEPYENRHLLERVPDYYERLRGSYDERFFQQEALGQYVNLQAGRVYRAFTRSGNVEDSELDRARPLLWALDFNFNPMSSVVAQMDGDRVRVLDEIVLKQATTRQACEEFDRRYQKHSGGVIVYADATGARRQTAGTSDVEVLKQFFRSGDYGNVKFRIPAANPPVEERVALMNAKLEAADGTRSIQVSSRCVELLKDFEQVQYKEGSQVIDKEGDPKRTHLSDALGYLVWQEFHSKGGSFWQNQRLI